MRGHLLTFNTPNRDQGDKSLISTSEGISGNICIVYTLLDPTYFYCPNDNSSKERTRSPNWMV